MVGVEGWKDGRLGRHGAWHYSNASTRQHAVALRSL